MTEFFADSLVNGILQSSMMVKGIVIVQLAASVVLPSYVIAPIAGDDYRLIFLMLGAIPLLPAVLSPFLPVKDMFIKEE